MTKEERLGEKTPQLLTDLGVKDCNSGRRWNLFLKKSDVMEMRKKNQRQKGNRVGASIKTGTSAISFECGGPGPNVGLSMWVRVQIWL